MAVTSKVELSEPPYITYPALFKSIRNGQVVLFTGMVTGTLLSQGGNGTGFYPLGYHDTNWKECIDKDTWERLPIGTTITLTQE